MFKKILIPTDGSPLSEKAIEAAIEFSAAINAEIICISVADPYIPIMPFLDGIPLEPYVNNEDTRKMFEEQIQKIAKDNVQYAKDVAKKRGINCETLIATSSDPYKEIVNAAEKFHCDLIFMASHGRKGLSRLILGSETQKVIAYSNVPVLVHR